MTEHPTERNEEIEHARTCSECDSTTYQFERCHVCGDVPWKEVA